MNFWVVLMCVIQAAMALGLAYWFYELGRRDEATRQFDLAQRHVQLITRRLDEAAKETRVMTKREMLSIDQTLSRETPRTVRRLPHRSSLHDRRCHRHRPR